MTTAHDQMRVVQVDAFGNVVGTLVSSLNTAAGQVSSLTFTVTPVGGMIGLRFSDQGGANANWVVNAIDVRPLPASAPVDPAPGAASAPQPTEPQHLITISDPTPVADGTQVTGYTLTDVTPGSLVTVSTAFGTLVGVDASSKFAGFQVLDSTRSIDDVS